MCPTQSVDSKPDPPDLSSNSDTSYMSGSKALKSGGPAKTNVSVASVCNVKTSTVLPTAMVDVIDSRVPKIVDLLLFTALPRQLAPSVLDHIGLFLKG